MSARNILVTGATGKQGGAVVKALLASPPPFDYQILALTRRATSPAAKALASHAKVTLIEGDLNDSPAIFTKAGGVGSIWGVFCVTLPSFGKKEALESEQKQGCDLVDASLVHDVQHFVYTSVDRGGHDRSDTDATDIPHFASKYNVEHHLKNKVQGRPTHAMTYTILRPVAFMENLTPDFPGRVFAAMWSNMGDKKLQLVATKDIGIFAAQAFAASDTDEYRNKAISLAGDELTQAEANEVFWKALGRPMPKAYGFMGWFVQWMVPELGLMFKWFVDVGYGADVTQCRQLNKTMLNFEAWLRQESGFKR